MTDTRQTRLSVKRGGSLETDNSDYRRYGDTRDR